MKRYMSASLVLVFVVAFSVGAPFVRAAREASKNGERLLKARASYHHFRAVVRQPAEMADVEVKDEEQDDEPAEETEITTTLPEAPFSHLYKESDRVARDLELRRGFDFFPEGSHSDVDIPENEKHNIDSMFGQDPSVFGNCLLIRDFAEPLRVATSIREETSHKHRKHHKSHHLRRSGTPTGSSEERTLAENHIDPEEVTKLHEMSDEFSSGGDDDDDEKKIPKDLLIPEGGVIDRQVEEGEIKDAGAELQVSMFAWLKTIAGEVAVIPNGGISKWTSKKRVPLAGYLCTGPGGPVLHTLPTPCLPTAMGSDGIPFPPPPMQETDAMAEGTGNKEQAENSEEEEEEPVGGPTSETEDAEAAAEASDPVAAFLQSKTSSSPAAAPAAYPAAAPLGGAAGETTADKDLYHVWVGSTKLAFSSKPKADRFCARLTERIAEDLGDTEWDADELKEEDKQKDMSVSSFMLRSKKTAPDWTLGTKKVLVVVMDWMVGDRSRAPFSEQKKSPSHYRDRIFPRVREAFRQMSYGKFDIQVTVLPEVIRYKKQRSRYTSGGYPFPGLYNGAKESLDANQHWNQRYSFDDYDLVFVISPQQAPTGTKGVAWVGAKGAICNGCEEISENFQVMVAVHELGHNLGLSHASSSSLEYGNVFDWMGNYPDVTGLSYGLGYKLALKWLPSAAVVQVNDRDLPSLNDEYNIRPFDLSRAPRNGEIIGVKIRLNANRRDLFIAFRDSPEKGEEGVFLTWQDKDKPNSELIDAACHSVSQKDARMLPGWVYMDPSNSVVIRVLSTKGTIAKVHVFKAPDRRGQSGIRNSDTFTDGKYKCPRVCTDADLLVSMYKGCSTLAHDGYCRGGSITMSGKKMSIDKDLCPKACDNCDAVTAGSSVSGSSACADRNIKISGMNCRQAASSGYCSYGTNMGNIGEDLCPKSCGKCPSMPLVSSSSGEWQDPPPQRAHGSQVDSADEEEMPADDAAKTEKKKEEEEKEEEEAADREDAKKKDEEDKKDDPLCTDDFVWKDEDGDGCKVYGSFITSGKMTRKEACEYGDGVAKMHCRKTCNTCEVSDSTCRDKECVGQWRHKNGRCYTCSEFPGFCEDESFKADCPHTCGICEPNQKAARLEDDPLPTTFEPPSTTELTTTTEPPLTTAGPCEDQDCIAPWLKFRGKCFKCKDFAEEFCGRSKAFMKSCPRSCKTCIPHAQARCEDNFRPHVCRRYVSWHWCGVPHVREHCAASCGRCEEVPVVTEPPTLEAPQSSEDKSAATNLLANGAIFALALSAAHLLTF